MRPKRLPRALRLLALALPLAAALAPSGSTAADSSAPATGIVPHVMKSVNAARQAAKAAPAQAPLQYQSAKAPVETRATVYLIFWGQQWATGWTDVSNSGHVYTSGQAKQYITDYFKYVSSKAGAWNGTTTQYCSGVPVGSTKCNGGIHITNPPIFGGTWVDITSPPPPPVVPDNCAALVCLVPGSSADAANLLAAEAIRAQQHFLGKGYNANADYLLMLPEATNTVGSNSVYCAYHSQVKDAGSRWISYSNMPYVMNGNVGCGENFVNADNSYGNGFFDGYSIVAGHEFAEAETDPLPFTNTAWQDSSGAENGDKCAWLSPGTPGGAHNIGPDAHGHRFAVQTLYSNSAGGCAG